MENQEEFIAFDVSDESSEGETEILDVKSVNVLTPLPIPPWVDNPHSYPTDALDLLDQEIRDYLRYAEPSTIEQKLRVMVLKRLETSVKRVFPKASMHLFGSFKTRLYLPSSDMDVVILDKSLYAPSCLWALKKQLQLDNVASRVEVLEHAKVPLVKVVDALFNFQIDISFNLANGIAAAKVVRYFMDEPTMGSGVRALMLILKQFLLQRHMYFL
jgi:non-canonical poly(A) RNA polymerase PAPD5/7